LTIVSPKPLIYRGYITQEGKPVIRRVDQGLKNRVHVHIG
jgi:hypothetical protein